MESEKIHVWRGLGSWSFQGRDPEKKDFFRMKAPEIHEIDSSLWLNSKLLKCWVNPHKAGIRTTRDSTN